MAAKDAGTAFLAGVLEKLPEQLRTQAKGIFEAAEAEAALIAIGDGTLARSDYSKQMDAIREQEEALAASRTQFETLYAQNQSWYDTHKAAIDEYQVIKPVYDAWKATGEVPTGTPTTPTTPSTPAAAGSQEADMTREDVEKLVQAAIGTAATDVVGISAWTAQHAVEHFQRFGEVLPVADIVNATIAARQSGKADVTLDTMYQQRYGERLQAQAQEKETQRINQLAEERYQALLKERTGPGLPYPVRPDASPLDTIGRPGDPATYGVDAAVAEYTRLQTQRGAAPV